ncbi:MAG: alkaline phosphatase [Bradymonadia bacterium]
MASPLRTALLCLGTLTCVGCGGGKTTPDDAAPEAQAGTPARVKNVILMIGDGMGPQQVGLLEAYATRAPNSIYEGRPTGFHQLMDEGELGMSRHYPADGVVVDSACSATQLATGAPAGLEMVGLDAQGNPAQTIIELGREMGKATGIVSDTRITHATPASFAAHVAHRSMENEIAIQMLAANVDVLLSGGLQRWVPKGYDKAAVGQMVGGAFTLKSSKRKDDRDLLAEARAAGYSIAFDRKGLDTASDKVLGLFAWSGMADGITHSAHKDKADRRQPTLKEMTMAALDRLSKDPDGFVLMVEGGQIDWAGHSNDAGQMLHEMLKFDEAVGYVHQWVKARKENDTLLVVTADHETGSFGFSYSRNDLPEGKKLPGSGFDGLTYRPSFNFGHVDKLAMLYQQSKTFGQMVGQLADETRKRPGDLKIDYDADSPTEITRKEKARAQAMREIFNAHSAFKIDEAQALRMVQMEPNAYHVEGEYRDGHPHKYMKQKWVPKFDDMEEFYVNGTYDIKGLMGRVVAPLQGVVWGTGTHTHTPVPVISYGPTEATALFKGLIHHVEIGQGLKAVLESSR